MSDQATTAQKPANSKAGEAPPAGGNQLADLLAQSGHGIRITGLVLAADPVVERSGVGKKSGKPYAFASRQFQMFTGNRAVICNHQGEIGADFPPVAIGEVRTFKVKSMRLNGTEPVLDLEFTA